MKIALITDAWPPQISGVVTTLLQTVREVKNLGHDVLTIHPGLFKTVACPTYPQIRLAVNPIMKVAHLLRQFRPDSIHIVIEGPLGLAGRFYCLRRKYCFTTAFTTRFDEYIQLRFGVPSRIIFTLLRWFHKPATRVMISSLPLRKELEDKGMTNTSLWPRGVDTQIFRIRSKSFISDPRPIMMYVGRVAVEKNIETFLELPIEGTKFVVGDGPDLITLKQKYPAVRFVGAKKGVELACYYAAADVFVFPSLTDTFGIVILEAMACGIPVAAYPVRGPIDIIQQGETGYMSANLEEAVLKALPLDPHRCRAFAKQYSWDKSARYFINNLVSLNSDETKA